MQYVIDNCLTTLFHCIVFSSILFTKNSLVTGQFLSAKTILLGWILPRLELFSHHLAKTCYSAMQIVKHRYGTL